jgi:hypothetical protein
LKPAPAAEREIVTPNKKAGKEETLDTPHFEAEDTDELQQAERPDGSKKK